MSAYEVCAVDDVVAGQAKRFDVEGHRLAVVRIEDDFYILDDRCSHADISLSEGDVYAQDKEIECWKHGSTFSLVTGEPQCLPAITSVRTYEVSIQAGKVMVNI